MPARRAYLLSAALFVAGVAMDVLLADMRVLRGLGTGVAVGGLSFAFQAWSGPVPKRERRRIGALSLGVVLVAIALWLVVLLLTPRHSPARLGATALLAVSLVAAVAVVLRATRRARR